MSPLMVTPLLLVGDTDSETFPATFTSNVATAADLISDGVRVRVPSMQVARAVLRRVGADPDFLIWSAVKVAA